MQADQTIARRMDELARRAEQTGIAQVSCFLSPAQQVQADISARQAGISCLLEGGTPQAERRVAMFTDAGCKPDWPIVCLEIAWHIRYGAPGHRDILGSLLGLGIGREMIGDLFVREGCAYALVLRDMHAYVASSLTRAGRVPVRTGVLTRWPVLNAAEETGKTVRSSVSSLRLDSLLSAAFSVSRGKASALVASDRVQVNHQPENRPDHLIDEGSVVSVRGIGRMRLASVDGHTKKGRIGITLLRY